MTQPSPEPEVVDEGPYYSIEEFAGLIRVHPKTVERWAKKGLVPSFRAGQTVRIPASALPKRSA